MYIARRTDRQAGGQAGRQASRQTDRQTSMQTCMRTSMHTCMHTYIYTYACRYACDYYSEQVRTQKAYLVCLSSYVLPQFRVDACASRRLIFNHYRHKWTAATCDLTWHQSVRLGSRISWRAEHSCSWRRPSSTETSDPSLELLSSRQNDDSYKTVFICLYSWLLDLRIIHTYIHTSACTL